MTGLADNVVDGGVLAAPVTPVRLAAPEKQHIKKSRIRHKNSGKNTVLIILILFMQLKIVGLSSIPQREAAKRASQAIYAASQEDLPVHGRPRTGKFAENGWFY